MTLEIAKQLSEAPNDDKTPYKTKYEARGILEKLKAEVEAGLAAQPTIASSEDYTKSKGKVAIVDALLGANYVDTEETPEGERCLSAALAFFKTQPRAYLSVLQETYNSLGVLWCGRSEYSKARDFIAAAKSVYHEHKDQQLAGAGESWKPEDCHKNYMLSLFFLAQVLSHLGEGAEAAQCIQATLQLQLAGDEYDPEDWATNCLHLNTFYANNEKFGHARHCLLAAEKVMPKDAAEPAHSNLALALGKLYLARLEAGATAFAAACKAEANGGPTVAEALGKQGQLEEEEDEPDPHGVGRFTFERCGIEPYKPCMVRRRRRRRRQPRLLSRHFVLLLP
eukprot:SAG22_NODE_5138_length_1079_cov_0.762245_1_plen_337_part_10